LRSSSREFAGPHPGCPAGAGERPRTSSPGYRGNPECVDPSRRTGRAHLPRASGPGGPRTSSARFRNRRQTSLTASPSARSGEDPPPVAGQPTPILQSVTAPVHPSDYGRYEVTLSVSSNNLVSDQVCHILTRPRSPWTRNLLARGSGHGAAQRGSPSSAGGWAGETVFRAGGTPRIAVAVALACCGDFECGVFYMDRESGPGRAVGSTGRTKPAASPPAQGQRVPSPACVPDDGDRQSRYGERVYSLRSERPLRASPVSPTPTTSGPPFTTARPPPP